LPTRQRGALWAWKARPTTACALRALTPSFGAAMPRAWTCTGPVRSLRNLDQRRRHLEDRLADARTDEERRRTREDLRDLDYAMRRARDRVREAEWALHQLR
jgi:hypothetical protein